MAVVDYMNVCEDPRHFSCIGDGVANIGLTEQGSNPKVEWNNRPIKK